ncbi:MAG: type II toxin-antitoxin system Phd/YefM family antitoxin [Propionibacteriaceae bacterium]|jgi:prevent-host-death family protein|nr:type II toxin-antitoxin system Phd/YefM family antitoxin [Propionibacteriaceae bacterium]
MQTVSIAQLRQNPTRFIESVIDGESVTVTRYHQEVARLVPPTRVKTAAAEQFTALLAATPVDKGWSGEVAADRLADQADDPWVR